MIDYLGALSFDENIMEKKNTWRFFSDDFGLRSPAIQKTFQTKKCYLNRSTRLSARSVLSSVSSKLKIDQAYTVEGWVPL